jgi:hypothetical protein
MQPLPYSHSESTPTMLPVNPTPTSTVEPLMAAMEGVEISPTNEYAPIGLAIRSLVIRPALGYGYTDTAWLYGYWIASRFGQTPMQVQRREVTGPAPKNNGLIVSPRQPASQDSIMTSGSFEGRATTLESNFPSYLFWCMESLNIRYS